MRDSMYENSPRIIVAKCPSSHSDHRLQYGFLTWPLSLKNYHTYLSDNFLFLRLESVQPPWQRLLHASGSGVPYYSKSVSFCPLFHPTS
ncbi:hypothetical protein Ciccas_013032 [Cichlidogyrus casuarinus]|uniref:Uncharacterized protein n=1 Tax=Cichlidogyrus casuarinus TaxID=1844966 RepID=A0ABD2PNH0_9PLAT